MAIQIFQKWLDDASRTFIASQFNAYRSLVQLPIEMTSDHSTVVMTNDTMLRQVFLSVSEPAEVATRDRSDPHGPQRNLFVR